MGRFRILVAAAIAAPLLWLSAPALGEAPLPVEKFAEIPLARAARLSPDGTKLGVIASRNGREVLLIRGAEGGNHYIELGAYQPRWVAWKSPTRLVSGVFSSTDNLFWGGFTHEATVTRMFAVDADGTHVVNIGEPPGGFLIDGSISGQTLHPQLQDELAGLLENDPHHVLQTVLTKLPYKSSAVSPAVYLVDIDTGRRQEVVHPRYPLWDFMPDPTGEIHLAIGGEGTEKIVMARDDSQSSWREIRRLSINGAQYFHPVGYVPDAPGHIHVIAPAQDPQRTGLWDFDTARNDFDHLIDDTLKADGETQTRDGILISYRAGPEGLPHYLDPAWERDFQIVRKALGNKEAEIVDRTADGNRALFKMVHSHEPDSWWLLDRTQKPAHFTPVIQTYPEIAEAGIAPVAKMEYQARDGLALTAYVTLPRHGQGGPIPFVVLPHDGPHDCDSEGFDYQAQFFASRGWGVIQPEFRGSSCFALEFQKLGYGEWGFKMQDDVTDATRWLIDWKLADPARICIVGSGYGGYAALEGATKEPDLYRCAAAWAPVTDLSLLKRDDKHLISSEILLDRLGNDWDRLEAASPAQHAERIKVPVLLMHGKADATVQVRHTEAMESALKDAGKPVEAIYLDGADHYRLQYPARLAWLQALERFLGANLGRPETASATQ